MTDRTDQQKEAEQYAKRKLREVARQLESAQGTATLDQLVSEVEEAGAELAHIRTELREHVDGEGGR
jgi:hypothetical protein